MAADDDSDSDPSKVERIVSKFFSKCIHVILQSRYMTNNANSDDVVVTSTVDKWFNLNLRDFVPSELIHVTGVSSSVQLVLDLVLLHSRATMASPSYGRDRRWEGGRVIERWVMMFEGNNKRVDTGRVKYSSKLNIFYKKCVLMLRSLCVMVKLLPAYKLFKDLTASSKPSEFSIGHHISSFVEPFTREEEANMQKYLFNPVETSCGRLCLSVFYISSPGDLTAELSYHLLPHLVIPDYCRPVLVERPVCKAPKLHSKGMVVTYGKPSLLTTAKVTATQPQDAATRESTAVSVKRQWPATEAALSTSLSCSRTRSFDAPSHPAKTLSHAAQRSASFDHLRCEAHDFLNPEEVRDPFQPKLSDNAVIGSMFSIFSEAAPLRRTSVAFTPNKPDPQAASVNVRVPTNGSVKTTSDALQELQKDIELKKSILQRTSSTVSHSSATRLSAGQESTPGSK